MIAEYIARESRNLATGVDFVRVLRAQCKKLAMPPGSLGRARPEFRPDLRSFAMRGYVIFFRYAGQTLEVVNVLHGQRDLDAFFRDDEE